MIKTMNGFVDTETLLQYLAWYTAKHLNCTVKMINEKKKDAIILEEIPNDSDHYIFFRYENIEFKQYVLVKINDIQPGGVSGTQHRLYQISIEVFFAPEDVGLNQADYFKSLRYMDALMAIFSDGRWELDNKIEVQSLLPLPIIEKENTADVVKTWQSGVVVSVALA